VVTKSRHWRFFSSSAAWSSGAAEGQACRAVAPWPRGPPPFGTAGKSPIEMEEADQKLVEDGGTQDLLHPLFLG